MLARRLAACGDYDAIGTSSNRGNGPVDVAGVFVDAFVAWIGPSLAFIRRVRGRTRSFWIPNTVSVLMKGVSRMREVLRIARSQVG